MAEKPKFRRGIKLGRIVRITDRVATYRHRYNPATGRKEKTNVIRRYINRTVGYKDKKTGKVLKPAEVQSFKQYKKSELESRLRKLPENHPSRMKKSEGKLVDRFTGKPASRQQTLDAKEKALRGKAGSISPLLPDYLRKAAQTVTRRNGFDPDWALRQINDWWIKYELQDVKDPFPFSAAGSDFIGKAREVKYARQ